MNPRCHHIAAHFDDEGEASEAVADLDRFRGPKGVTVVVHHGGCLEVDTAEDRMLRNVAFGMGVGAPAGVLLFAGLGLLGAAKDDTITTGAVLGIAAGGAIFGVLLGGIVGILLGTRSVEEAHRAHYGSPHTGDEVVVATVDTRRFHRFMVERTHTMRPPAEQRERDRMEDEIRDVLSRHHGELIDIAV